MQSPMGLYLQDSGKPLNNAGWGETWSELHFKKVTLAAAWGSLGGEVKAGKLDAMVQVRGSGTLDKTVDVGVGQMC